VPLAWVEDQLDTAPGQDRADFAGAAEQFHSGGLGGDDPPLGHKNASRSCAGDGGGEWGADQPPVDERLPSFWVRPGVIDGLRPGSEQPVQLGQAGDLLTVADLDEELLAAVGIILPSANTRCGCGRGVIGGSAGAWPGECRVREAKELGDFTAFGRAPLVVVCEAKSRKRSRRR
jgi:hypothetical protein